MGIRTLSLFAWIVVTLSACSPRAVEREPAPDLDIPDAYGVSSLGGAELDAWCSEFGDSELEGLVDRALDENFTLRAAWTRIDQLEAIARQTDSTRWPSIDAQATAGRSRGPAPAPLEPSASSSYQISVGAAYEVDVWGRMRSVRDAAELDVEAIRSDVQSLAITVSAQVAEAYFDVVHQRAVRALIADQLEIISTNRELMMLRLNYGQASALDIYGLEQQAQALEAQLTLVDAAEEVARHRLAVLVGTTPGNLELGDRVGLPALPARPSLGYPADLLSRRPDLRAAQARVAAADYRVASAMADRLPALRLNGSVFLSASDPLDLLNDLFWSITGGIFAPLFDGGRRTAEVDRTEAALEDAVYTYAGALLQAIQEVESSIVLEDQQLAYIDVLGSQSETALASLDVARENYRNGNISYLRVLDSLAATLNIEQSRLAAQRQLLTYRVQLCRSLGGDWTEDLENPNESDGGEE